MTWEEAKYSLQVMAEERVGARMREDAARARALEDSLAAGLAAKHRAQEGR